MTSTGGKKTSPFSFLFIHCLSLSLLVISALIWVITKVLQMLQIKNKMGMEYQIQDFFGAGLGTRYKMFFVGSLQQAWRQQLVS